MAISGPHNVRDLYRDTTGQFQTTAESSEFVICTSSTRPSSPSTGNMIYETDTAKVLIWNGSAWTDVSHPVGSLTAHSGATAPTGWLLCDGAAVSRTTYDNLFSVISTTFGTGDGSTTFNVPDFRGRMPMGAGSGAQQGGSGSGAISGGTALTTRTRGQFGGDERMQLHTHIQNSHNHMQNAHNHNITSKWFDGSGGHNHGSSGGTVQQGSSTPIAANGTYQDTSAVVSKTATNIATTATNQNTGSGQSENMPPFVVINYIIKT